MKTPLKNALLAVAIMMLTASATLAGKGEVVDPAGFFSPDAIAAANKQLAETEQKFNKQMRVETVAALPPEARGNRDAIQRWVRGRAEKEGIRGVMIVISRDPSTLQVEVGGDTVKSGAFTLADRTRMRDLLVEAFKAKNYDQGLTQAIEFFREKLQAHAAGGSAAPAAAAAPTAAPSAQRSTPAPSTPPSGSPPMPRRSIGTGWTGLLCIGLAVVLGVFLLRRLFAGPRQYQGGPGGPGGYPPGAGGYGAGYGGGGGGFGTGLGGGLLGGLFGSWLGNRMFGGHNDPGTGYSSAPPPSDQGTFNEPSGSDFSSGGGSAFGGSSDLGGGDSGGGGGDFGGGGGGDSGSGGGDF